MGTKLRMLWPTLAGFALIVIALLGGFLLPVAKDCPGAFEYQRPVRRTIGMLATCKEFSVPMAFVWSAVIVVGAAGIIFGLFRAYRSVRSSAPAGRVSTQSSFYVAPQPESTLQQSGDRVLDRMSGSGSPTTDVNGALQRAERKPRKWPHIMTIVVLAVGVLGLGAAYAYSTNSAAQWRATADQTSRNLASITAERDRLSEKNTTLTSQLSDTNGKLNDTTTQLNDANARIRSLANEKAQAGDNAAFLAGLVVDSQNVSAGMSTCIRDLQTLQTYLVNYSAYDQAALISFVRDVNSRCNSARADSDSLTQKIQGLR
jgi:Tfp pilus assembly protein PilV